ncbi:MlaD family protein [Desulfonatronovibrio hydrogenovorans]|uniref:MlaD family protein n=1 Tax=Desulfonatronovibrio hydrogenovorans TaxID=53245 RepID=UPI00048B298E|nr:MlaD family protein [Desulfonatronovibrio hydrogenovorans]
MKDGYRSVEFRAGLLVIFFMVALVSIFLYIGFKKELFAERVTYYVISDTGERIERGIPVRLSGFRIGQVENVSLDAVDFVTIEIRILKKYQRWMVEDSKIILDQEGIIGKPYLKLLPGSEDAQVLEAESRIRLDKVGGISELIEQAQPVMDDLKAIVANIRSITDQLLLEDGPVQVVLGNIQEMTTRLNESQGLVYYLVEDPRPVEKVENILAGLDDLARSFEDLVESGIVVVDGLKPIEQEFLGITREAREFVGELRGIRSDIAPIVENLSDFSFELKRAGQDMYRIRQEGEYALRLGTELLHRLSDTWPLSRPEPDYDRSFPLP